MHIHGVQNFVGQATQAGRGAELAARAASNRKKLLEVGGEAESENSQESAWMISGWGGGGQQRRQGEQAGSRGYGSGDSEPGVLGTRPAAARRAEQAGKASWWA
jgi:hypothetical protein